MGTAVDAWVNRLTNQVRPNSVTSLILIFIIVESSVVVFLERLFEVLRIPEVFLRPVFLEVLRISSVPGIPGMFGAPVKSNLINKKFLVHPKKKPRVEMKALFWDKILDNKITGTVWEKVK